MFLWSQKARFPESAGERYAIAWGKLAFLCVFRAKKRSRLTATAVPTARGARAVPRDLQSSNSLTLNNYFDRMVGGTGIEPVTPAV